MMNDGKSSGFALLLMACFISRVTLYLNETPVFWGFIPEKCKIFLGGI